MYKYVIRLVAVTLETRILNNKLNFFLNEFKVNQ